MKNNHRSSRAILHLVILAFLLLLIPSILSSKVSARTSDVSEQSMEVLEQGETIDGPGFFSGDVVQIDGTITGTTFAVGEEVHINGTINGSLFVIAQTVVINGEITGNIYAAGQSITVTTKNEGDVFLAGETVTITPEAQLGRDLFVAASSVLHEGSVPRHLFGGAQRFTLNGLIGGNAFLDLEQLTLQESAVIEGNLSYQSSNEATLNSNATINGQIDWDESVQQMTKSAPSQMDRFFSALIGFLWSILSAMLVWFVIKLWRSSFWIDAMRPISVEPLKAIGVGLLVLAVAPLLAILSLLTLIGIPLGLILIVLYVICLYLSKIVIAVFIGSWLTTKFKWNMLNKEVWHVLIGLLILESIDLLPFVGFIIGLLVTVAGLGSFVLTHYKSPSSTTP